MCIHYPRPTYKLSFTFRVFVLRFRGCVYIEHFSHENKLVWEEVRPLYGEREKRENDSHEDELVARR